MMSFIKEIKFYKKLKGSTTVEATMIFPLILLIIFGIIYLTIVHYQNSVMIAESMRAMNRAGAYWQYIDMGLTKDPLSNKPMVDFVDYDDEHIPFPFNNEVPAAGLINFRMIAKRNAYRSLIDVISEAVENISNDKIQLTKKMQNAKQYVQARMANVKFRQYNKDNIANGENYGTTSFGKVTGEGFMFIGDDLSVDVSRSYINPVQNLAKIFLGKDYFLGQNKTNKDIVVKGVISNQAEFIRNLDSVYDLGATIYEIVVP